MSTIILRASSFPARFFGFKLALASIGPSDTLEVELGATIAVFKPSFTGWIAASVVLLVMGQVKVDVIRLERKLKGGSDV